MANNTDRTEDMVDQTFDVDNEITNATQFTEEQTQLKEKPVNTKVNTKSSNAIIFIGVGVAAVAMIGYEFVLPMFLGNHAPKNNVNKINPVNSSIGQIKSSNSNSNLSNKNLANSNNVPASSSSAQSPNVANVSVPNNPVNLNSPAASFLDGNKNGNTNAPNNISSTNTTSNNEQNNNLGLAPNNQKNVAPLDESNTSNQNNQLANALNTQQNSNMPNNNRIKANENLNNQQLNVVDNLQKMFEKQNESFKNSLTDLDSRVSALEDSNKEQAKVNQEFNQRISKLEKLNHLKVENYKNLDTSKMNEEKHQPIKHFIKHDENRVIRHVAKEEKHVNNSNVLINKRNMKPIQKEVEQKQESVSLQPLHIYSIYSGRVWIKNSNGSLSTYSVGDRLPTGEIIKKVDNDKLEIITNMRTISE